MRLQRDSAQRRDSERLELLDSADDDGWGDSQTPLTTGNTQIPAILGGISGTARSKKTHYCESTIGTTFASAFLGKIMQLDMEAIFDV